MYACGILDSEEKGNVPLKMEKSLQGESDVGLTSCDSLDTGAADVAGSRFLWDGETSNGGCTASGNKGRPLEVWRTVR